MGQMPTTDPAQSITDWIGGVLLVPRLRGHQTIHCLALRRYLEELIQQGFLKEYVLTPEAISRETNAPSSQEQNVIA